MAPALAALTGIHRSYPRGDETLHVLTGIDLEIAPGERISLEGASGSGKSTLLGILGLIDARFTGGYRFDGADVRAARDATRATWRLHRVGSVFQQLHLVPSLDAVQNVALPALAAGVAQEAAYTRARSLLAAAGLESRGSHHPAELSGGERRRVAVARALVNRPALVLADEPTAELDAASAQGVRTLLSNAHAEGAAVIVASHDPDLLQQTGTRRLRLDQGRLTSVA